MAGRERNACAVLGRSPVGSHVVTYSGEIRRRWRTEERGVDGGGGGARWRLSLAGLGVGVVEGGDGDLFRLP